jgi:hypothetical protein
MNYTVQLNWEISQIFQLVYNFHQIDGSLKIPIRAINFIKINILNKPNL